MKKLYFLFAFVISFVSYGQDMVITGVFDGPLSGGTPKLIEVYVINDIADLTTYGIGSANNGGGTDGEEFTFAGSATAGDYIYISSDDTNAVTYFGITPDYVSSVANNNGNDALELFLNGGVIDIFGDINTDGTGEPWEYLDGWAYRVDDTGPDGTTFSTANWTFSSPNAVDGCSDNDSCSSVFPIGTYANTLSTDQFNVDSISMFPNPTATGYVNIATRNSDDVNVTVYDVLGKVVKNENLNKQRIDVSDLTAGMYLVKISSENNSITKKLIIQ